MHKAYFMDLKSDPHNLIFGTLNKNDIGFYFKPKFCLGLSKNEGITVR